MPSPFEYHAPASLAEAIALLARHGEEARVLAGGHSLLPMMKLGAARPRHVIDLGLIPDLRGISEVGDEVHVGAMTTENQLIRSPLLARRLPLLVEGARSIADPQVRYRGTIGGDISHGDPGNDHPALMLALDASFVLCGPGGERLMKAGDFFAGRHRTRLEHGELLVRLQLPAPPAGTGWAYEKLKRHAMDVATVAAAVLLRTRGGQVSSAVIALTNVAATPLRASRAEAVLIGRPLDAASLADAVRLAQDACDPVPDQHGDAAAKRAMAGEMTRLALLKAHSRIH